jgi:hypothetical protein
MSGFEQSGKLTGWYESDVTPAAAPDDEGFLLVYHPVQQAGEVLTQARTRGLKSHR